MDYCVRGGHNYGVPGASSKWLDEVDFDRKYSKELMSILKDLDFSVIDGTPNKTSTSSQDLRYGVNIANNNKVKDFISCHVNCADSSNARGCEVLYYRGSSIGKELAEKICSKLAELGFKNRGAKADDRGLYELRHTNMPAVIIEPFFLSSKEDVDLALKVGPKAIAQKIAEGLTGKKISNNAFNDNKKTITKDEVKDLQRLLNVYKFTDNKGNKLVQDGIVGNKTYQALDKCIVKFGQNNQIVRWIKKRLVTLGYNVANVNTGNYDLYLSGKLTDHQKLYGLKTDGIVGINTWRILL